jgi:hypothetical protein
MNETDIREAVWPEPRDDPPEEPTEPWARDDDESERPKECPWWR